MQEYSSDFENRVLDDDEIEELPERSKKQAMKRGVMMRCPCCGEGKIYRKYLKIVDRCGKCDEELGHIRTDDFAPWATILILGHLLAPFIIDVERNIAPPLWVSLSIFLPIIVVATLVMLPPIKGACLGLMWALRMRGDEQH
ncbi:MULTISPECIES: DUF983 domain-containing protein [Curvivirga]|uniref:DUF983 domain-containing protein n=1 Tax=Curvivirga TaxID=2856846 RepID=UPI001C3FA24E|nr:DUF983 domain-containing protein [Curvivirga aplysinae]